MSVLRSRPTLKTSAVLGHLPRAGRTDSSPKAARVTACPGDGHQVIRDRRRGRGTADNRVGSRGWRVGLKLAVDGQQIERMGQVLRRDWSARKSDVRS